MNESDTRADTQGSAGFSSPGLLGWGSAALGIWLRPGWGGAIALGALALICVSLIRGRREHPLVQMAVVSAIAALMMLSVVLGAHHREQPALSDREDSEVSVTVSLRETYTPGTRSLSVSLTSVDGEAVWGGECPLYSSVRNWASEHPTAPPQR